MKPTLKIDFKKIDYKQMQRFIFCCTLIMTVSAAALISCIGDDDDDNNPGTLEFISLELDNDSIFVKQTTKVRAKAKGEELTFTWSTTKGDISGSDSVVTYVAPPCTPGKNTISCTVTDKYNNSETKTTEITVL